VEETVIHFIDLPEGEDYVWLADGKWQATVRHPSGRKMTKTDALKRVVEAWGDETERSFRMGDVPAERGRGLTVQQWHDRWIKARNVAATTAHEERLRLDRYVLPRWGTWPLRSIGRIDVQAWVTDLGRERGAHVTFGCYQVLRKMLIDAELEGFLSVSPCRKIDLPKLERPRRGGCRARSTTDCCWPSTVLRRATSGGRWSPSPATRDCAPANWPGWTSGQSTSSGA
jgi:hypothetical protein